MTIRFQRLTFAFNPLLVQLIKRPWKGAYLFSPQFPRRLRRIIVSLEYLPYY